MKTWPIVVLPIIAGIALGVAAPFWQRWSVAGGGIPNLDVAEDFQESSVKDRIGPRPVAEVDATEFQFGTMALGATRAHAFTITNRGDAPLELRKGSTSCKCTISDFKEGALEPGESAEIRLEWTAKLIEGNFREIATILTNDPLWRRIDLSVVGRVKRTVNVEPFNVVFSKINVDQEQTARVRLLSFGDEPLEITHTKLGMRSKDNASFFDVSVEPISKAKLGDPDAKSGFAVLLTVKPGIPVGTFQGTLEIKTNVRDKGVFVLPVSGKVVSDFSVDGPGWSSDSGILALGTVRGRQGRKRSLLVTVRGQDREKIEFGPIETDPECLHVTLGEKKSLDRVVGVRLTVEIPAGTRPINRLGTAQAPFGEIVIHTNHPKAKELRLLVRFAVER